MRVPRTARRSNQSILKEISPGCSLSSCSRSLRPLVELCVEPAGLCGRCTGVAVPLRVVPSPKGLPSNNAGDMGLIPGLGRSPEEGHANLLQYSCLKNTHGHRSLVGYSPWGRQESDTTERLRLISTCQQVEECLLSRANCISPPVHLHLLSPAINAFSAARSAPTQPRISPYTTA